MIAIHKEVHRNELRVGVVLNFFSQLVAFATKNRRRASSAAVYRRSDRNQYVKFLINGLPDSSSHFSIQQITVAKQSGGAARVHENDAPGVLEIPLIEQIDHAGESLAAVYGIEQ